MLGSEIGHLHHFLHLCSPEMLHILLCLPHKHRPGVRVSNENRGNFETEARVRLFEAFTCCCAPKEKLVGVP